ncbi:MAG: hypothetical protein ACOZCO_15690 [Bacteroidota bacterium]
MKKTLKRIGWIVLIAIVIFLTYWIIKTKMNAPSDEQLQEEKKQDDTLYQGDGGKIDNLDKLVSDDMDSTGTDTTKTE